MTTILIVGTILIALLSLALWHCYKTNKPLREKAREDRRQAEQKAEQEAREAHAKLLRDELRVKVYSDIEQALSDPDYTLRDHRYGQSQTRGKYRWDSLAKLGHLLKVHTDTAERLDKQSQLIREQRSQIKALQANIEDIKQALQMGTPVEL